MRITKISLTNFRSFQAAQSIALAPVTLLFGPNSVGKSSVLMALAYVQQILSKGHCDPQKLGAFGDKAIGGFRALVHGQDLQKSIKIRLDYAPEKTPFSYYDSGVHELANRLEANYLVMDDFGGRIEAGSVEFEIAWSDRHKRAFVKNYRVWVNGAYVGCIASSDDLKNTYIHEINTQHPLLIPPYNDQWLDVEYGEEEQRLDMDLEFSTEFEFVLDQLNPNPANTAAVADAEGSGEFFVNRVAPISLACFSGAIPLLRTPVGTNLTGQEFDDGDGHLSFLAVQQVLSQAFVLPLDKILDCLEESISIGPLRLVPDNDYVPNPHPEQADWVDGSAAWDLLYKDPNSDDSIKRLLRNTSDWFSSKDKLDAGYEIVNHSLTESIGPMDKPISPELMGLLNERHVFFKELRTNIRLSANQLGTGISQVLPIVVASNYDEIGLISIEQPELHIHPRFQVELSDVFLHARDKHSFLIETHSEHLILRLLKRIRQSTDGELPKELMPVDKNDISIVYLEPSENGVVAKRIHVDEDGEFKDRWPHGFFVERREELL